MAETIAFRSLDTARSVRTDKRVRPFLAESDDARTTTVVLEEGTPGIVLEDVEGQAAETRAEAAEEYGQVPLTESERGRIDFTRTNVPTARAAKGIAQAKGVDDFIAYFDPELTVDEHREVFERAATEGGGQRGGREQIDEREIDRRIAGGFQERQKSELGRAKRFAFEDADTEAREFLGTRGRRSEVFDISFRQEGSVLVGQGEDFDRLRNRHENRSQRAQTVDEQRSAPITRDPFQWYDAPSKWDYPGIDTVQPAKLHASRSKTARTVDERELAPLTRDKEQWARNPDRWDYEGVDTPTGFSRGMSFDDVGRADFDINLGPGDS